MFGHGKEPTPLALKSGDLGRVRIVPNIALVTCAALPDLEDEERFVLPHLRELGVDVQIVTWDDPAVDWLAFDITVIRSTWDYYERRDEFVAWAHSVPSLANPAPVVEWNTDKTYLGELAELDVAVVPTTWLTPNDTISLPNTGEHVIKPSISAGSTSTGRYQLGDAGQRALAVRHARQLHERGATVMVQPYMPAVDTTGETALLYINGSFSHAIRKGPMLNGPHDASDDDNLYRAENIDARVPTAAQHDAAQRVLDTISGFGPLLYARVDLVPGDDGAPLLIELELTEPSLFLSHDRHAAQRFAEAIVAYSKR